MRVAGSSVYEQFPEADSDSGSGGGGGGGGDEITVTPPAGGDTQPDGSIRYEGDTEVTFTASYTGTGSSPVYAWTATGAASITGGADTPSATVAITYTPGTRRTVNTGTVVCNITAELPDGGEDKQSNTTKISKFQPR